MHRCSSNKSSGRIRAKELTDLSNRNSWQRAGGRYAARPPQAQWLAATDQVIESARERRREAAWADHDRAESENQAAWKKALATGDREALAVLERADEATLRRAKEALRRVAPAPRLGD